MSKTRNLHKLAYIIGVAIGDGNLSNPNRRAVRLRVSCDIKYPNLIIKISSILQELFPKNKIGIVKRGKNCIDISCYSNKWEAILGWKASCGSKFHQQISVPKWIKRNEGYSIACLRGLIETDGSVYKDRKYVTVNFVTIIPSLSKDVMDMICRLGFSPNIQVHKPRTGKINIPLEFLKIQKNLYSF